NMVELNRRALRVLHCILFASLLLTVPSALRAKPRGAVARSAASTPAPAKKATRQDDSVFPVPEKDLSLRLEGEHKAEALAHFVEGMSFEENGEMDKALAAYRKVLDVDPGQAELASRVAALLARQDDYPLAIDVLKDAIKANPKAPEPLLQLAFIYTKYLQRSKEAIELVNRAIALD